MRYLGTYDLQMCTEDLFTSDLTIYKYLQKIQRSRSVWLVNVCWWYRYIRVYHLLLYQSVSLAAISECITCCYIRVYHLLLYQSVSLAAISEYITCCYNFCYLCTLSCSGRQHISWCRKYYCSL